MGGNNPKRKSTNKKSEPKTVETKSRNVRPPSPEYFVERIVKRKEEKGRTMYLVKWQGWPS
jgi:hypothetical protein